MGKADTKTATIANGESLSDVVDLGDGRIYAIQMPSAWTAADLTFQAQLPGGEAFDDIYDVNDAEKTIVTAASQVHLLQPNRFSGLGHIKIRSGTSALPVNQGAERKIIISTIKVV